MAICVGINVLCSRMATAFGWPLYLDTPGTILAGALCGPIPGILVGYITNAVTFFYDDITLYYTVLNVLVGLAAGYLAGRGDFTRPLGIVKSILVFVLIDGIVGTPIIWLLYGLDVGSGPAAVLAAGVTHATGMTGILAFFCAQLLINLLDKGVIVPVICLVLRVMPEGLLAALPNGDLFGKSRPSVGSRVNEPVRPMFMRISLRYKVAILIIVTACILTGSAVAIAYMDYRKAMMDQFTELATSAATQCSEVVDGNKVADFLANGEQAAGYADTRRTMERIRATYKSVEFVYVYQIRQDGVHVVFDLDSDAVKGASPGTVLTVDKDYEKDLPTFYEGGEITPRIVRDEYGWLYTVYKPIRDSSGQCTAYVGVDIAMDGVIADRYIFVTKIISQLLGTTILIVAFALWYASKKVVNPINSLAVAARDFAFNTESGRARGAARMNALDIRTGDEIENLYQSICKTTLEMSRYIELVDEKSKEVASKAGTIARMQDNMIVSFADMVENRDENTGGHIRRTSAYVSTIAGAMYDAGDYPEILTAEYLENMRKSAPLHDIGKIKISDAVLNKPGRLTTEEFDFMKTHTTEGARILRNTMRGLEDEEYLSVAIDMACYHHEWWDGTGYPNGLAGEAIPLSARIMAVADVFDALVSKRCYKDAFRFEQAVHIIEDESGTHFDPVCVAAFMRARESIQATAEESAE